MSVAFDYNQLRIMKHLAESSILHFTRYIFKNRESKKFIINEHHKLICETLERVMNGEISRLIINMPPGYTKTELAVMSFILYGLAINPRNKFIHVSYSADLALENSSRIKEVIESDYYQELWPMGLKADSKSKRKWYTEYGGGMYAVGSTGAVTGFRAGRMEPGYSGAIIIDDPIKPEEAHSDTIRQKVNRKYTNTIKNRVALETVPIIIIMQRVHDNDLSAFLLRGGSEEFWHHLEIPAILDGKREYPKDFKYGIPIDYNHEDGALWEYKHDIKQLKKLQIADKYTFTGQYLQRPTIEGGSIFDIRFFHYYKNYNMVKGEVTDLDGNKIKIDYCNIYADTAMKAKETNDYSVFQIWAKCEDDRIYLLDMIRGKWESPDLYDKALQFYDKWEYRINHNHIGVRYRFVEDKASGTGLIQSINKARGDQYVIGIPRHVDKVSRARSCAPKIKQGLVLLPTDEFFVEDFILEFEAFSPTDSHRYDDQVDTTMDAIHSMLIDSSQQIDYSGAM